MPYVYAACPVHVTICSTGGKFRPVSNLMELHAVTLATCSYALLALHIAAGRGRCGLSCTWKVVVGYVLNVDRLMCMYRFVVCEVFINGTRCRDGVKVLWCRSHLVCLVSEGSIPTCTCFVQKTFFCDFIPL